MLSDAHAAARDMQPAHTPLTDAALLAHRLEYPGLQQRIYLNFGARGVMPRAALQAICDSLETLQSLGPGSRPAHAWMEYELEATRQALAQRIGVAPERIALVDSISTACALAIWGTRWRAGDHALICESEPPGTWAALRQAAERCNVCIDSFPAPAADDGAWLDALRARLLPTTRLVIASHVDWITGSQLSLAQLTQTVRGGPSPAARILIDGAQAVGTVPIDLCRTDIDLYAFGAQKWLCGPDGIAALFVSEAAQSDIAATLTGWRGVEPTDDGLDIRLRSDARRYESGSVAYALLAGLRSAIETQELFAPLALRSARITQLSGSLRARLEQLAGLRVLGSRAALSGIVSLQIAGHSCASVLRHLEANDIIVRQHYLPSCVRVCVHYLTLAQEVDRLCVALGELCRG
jgi:L-cysteine/cystine lyase